jgi:hypothetical protein
MNWSRPVKTKLLLITAAAIAALSSAAWAGGSEYDGSASSSDGKKTSTGKFEYNTQNNGNSVISQDTAVALGLGTLDGSGVFTPNKDPSTGKAPKDFNHNNGSITGYVYADITITVTGSDGKKCTYKGPVEVVKDRVGGNKAWAKDNTLGTDWINNVKGAIYGAGDKAQAFWPRDPPKKKKTSSKTTFDINPTNDSRLTFDFKLGGNGATTILPMVYETGTDFSYIPFSVAQALHLTLSPSPVDLSVFAPEDLRTLQVDQFDENNQTQFYQATLPSLDDVGGIASTQFNLTLFVNDDANSQFGILGTNALSHYAYFSQIDPSDPDGIGQSVLAGVPEPRVWITLLLGFGMVGLVARRRSTHTA